MEKIVEEYREWVQAGRRGFTLVELIVVAGIIGILFAMLLPAISKARQMAQDIVCKSSLKQISSVTAFYCEEYNGYTMPSDFTYNGGSSHYSWIDYQFNTSVNNAEIFKCPSAKDYFNPFGTPPASIGAGALTEASYIMNVIEAGKWGGAPISSAPSASTGWGSQTNDPVVMTTVQDPSIKIYIVCGHVVPGSSAVTRSSDARGIVDYVETDHGPWDTRDVGAVHSGRSNFSAGDGHVEDLRDSVPDQWVVKGN